MFYADFSLEAIRSRNEASRQQQRIRDAFYSDWEYADAKRQLAELRMNEAFGARWHFIQALKDGTPSPWTPTP